MEIHKCCMKADVKYALVLLIVCHVAVMQLLQAAHA